MTGRDPAAARFAVIQLVRAGGVAMVLGGILIQVRSLPALASVPTWLGFVLIGVGLAEFFIAPVLLARRWRSGPPPRRVP